MSATDPKEGAMNTLDFFYAKFAYNHWANVQALESMRGAGPPPPPRSLKWMGHIIGAEWLWMARLKGDAPDIQVWPELTVEGCADWMTHLPRAWQEYVVGLAPDGPGQPVAYHNSKGEPWTNRVEDVLMHVLQHSGYHRGQIASDVRAAGGEPAVTDYIHYIRQGFMKEGPSPGLLMRPCVAT